MNVNRMLNLIVLSAVVCILSIIVYKVITITRLKNKPKLIFITDADAYNNFVISKMKAEGYLDIKHSVTDNLNNNAFYVPKGDTIAIQYYDKRFLVIAQVDNIYFEPSTKASIRGSLQTRKIIEAILLDEDKITQLFPSKFYDSTKYGFIATEFIDREFTLNEIYFDFLPYGKWVR